jgi:hypothetical protein
LGEIVIRNQLTPEEDDLVFSDVFKVKSLIGNGAFGVVLSVLNTDVNDHSAVKVGFLYQALLLKFFL